MKKSVGLIIRTARERKDLDRTQLAKRLKISAGYLAHLENDACVTLSPRLVEALGKSGIRVPQALVDIHNKRASKWYRDYRAARAA